MLPGMSDATPAKPELPQHAKPGSVVSLADRDQQLRRAAARSAGHVPCHARTGVGAPPPSSFECPHWRTAMAV